MDTRTNLYSFANNYWKILLGFGALLYCFVDSELSAQDTGHPYPRTAVQHFGKAPDDWYARFDLVIVPHYDSGRPKGIKKINPKTLVLATSGWSAYSAKHPMFRYFGNEHDAWFPKDSNGKNVVVGWGPLINMSSLCPKVNGKTFNERHPEILLEAADMNYFDGISSDWCWEDPWGVKDIDLDRNGVNDFDEHGKNWVNSKWREGVEEFISNLRRLMGPDKLLWINSGKFHDFSWPETNGLEWERLSGFQWNSFGEWWKGYKRFMNNARKPNILLMDVRPEPQDPNIVYPTRDYFRLMRFMLTATMLGNGYFNYNPYEAGEHKYHIYYDEFDAKVGFPKTSAEQLSNGCYVRFFDRGAVITNPSGTNRVVSDSDLRSVSGYNGPYYRFQGGQAPDFNDGSKFTSVQLVSEIINFRDSIIGDGIILLSEKDTVVSDIIIDNIDDFTSAASSGAKLSGNWSHANSNSQVGAAYTYRKNGYNLLSFSSPNDGNNSAEFRPTLGVSGYYEVFEWHADVVGYTMATNVPHTIHYDNGKTKTVVVNQRENMGKWNSLGVYYLPKGTSSKVVISNKANNIVSVDAIMFRMNAGSEPDLVDIIAPAPPTGVKARRN